MKKFLSPLLCVLIPVLIVASLFIYSFLSSSDKSTNTLLEFSFLSSSDKSTNTLLEFSLTDLILVGLAIYATIYAILKKPWRENLAGHFKKAYRIQLKSIQKSIKKRDALREECNTFSVHQMSFPSLESMAEAMHKQDGYPVVSDLGKQLWDGNKEGLLKSLKDIEDIKNSDDAAKVLGNYAQMLRIGSDLLTETIRLQELKSLSKTGEISGTVMFSNEFAEDFPKQPQFGVRIRLKPDYIKSESVSQFWLNWNLFHPYDPNTGKKAKKRDLSSGDNWWLLSMSSPYWKYVLSICLDLEDVHHRLVDGRTVCMPPKNFRLSDGNYLLDLKGKTLFPTKNVRDGEEC